MFPLCPLLYWSLAKFVTEYSNQIFSLTGTDYFSPHKVYKCGVCGFYIIDLLGQLLNIRSNLASLQHNFASLRF